MIVSLSLGLLILRLTAGLIVAVHGSEKLFGWFGGVGFNTATKTVQAQGFKPAWFWVGLGIVGEFAGGLVVCVLLA